MSKETQTQILNETSNPILAVALSYLRDVNKNFTNEEYNRLKSTLELFLSKKLTYQYCQRLFIHMIGYTKPVDFLNYIMTISDTPLPASISDSTNGYQSTILSRKKSRPWTDVEDLRLLAGAYRYGLEAWGTIASFVGNSRTKSQCAQRWIRGLDPRLSKDNWLPKEDTTLIKLVEKYGQKSWTKIAFEMPNRCDIQCRYRYRQLMKEKPLPSQSAALSTSLSSSKVSLPPIHTLFNSTDENENRSCDAGKKGDAMCSGSNSLNYISVNFRFPTPESRCFSLFPFHDANSGPLFPANMAISVNASQ